MVEPKRKLKYRSHMSIGVNAAEQDSKFLEACFVSTGDFETIQDFESPKCILLGRTGVGKSASIIRIRNSHDNVINIDPETLSLKYISNSDVLRFLSNLGVKLDIFYRLLWQHVFCVELLNYHFKIVNETGFQRFKNWVSTTIKKDKSTELATQYLEKWNSEFWLEREERIKEITRKLEESISAEIGFEKYGVKARAGGEQGVAEEIRSEIVHKAQKVVNDIQIRHLGQVIDIIADEIYNDPKRKLYITIDGLDEDWVEDDIRYKLIRALIETTKKLRRISNVKVIIALRSDLLGRVYKFTRDSGFQEEKYEDLNLRVSWKPEQLKQLVAERLNYLFKDQYTGQKIEFSDVFPEKINKSGKETFEYMSQRTLMRPRDIIEYVNVILEQASGADAISGKMIIESEKIYSERRLNAILQEWIVEYPRLKDCTRLLYGKPTKFIVSDISQKEIEELMMFLGMSKNSSGDIIEDSARRHLNSILDIAEFRREVLRVFFMIGFIGYKEDTGHPWIYCYTNNVSEPRFEDDTAMQIHPMLWAVLGSKKLKNSILTSPENDNSFDYCD